MRANKIIALLLTGVWILSSCKTYLIPIESFERQFSGIDSTSLKKVRIKGATYDSYLANPIKKIDCIDKQGNAYQLNNGPAIEIRFTYGEKNRKTIFYFEIHKSREASIKGPSLSLNPKRRKRRCNLCRVDRVSIKWREICSSVS